MRTNIADLKKAIEERLKNNEIFANAYISIHDNLKKEKQGMASVNVFISFENKKRVSATIYIVEREKSTIALCVNNLNGDIIFSNTNFENSVSKAFDYGMQFIENCGQHVATTKAN